MPNLHVGSKIDLLISEDAKDSYCIACGEILDYAPEGKDEALGTPGKTPMYKFWCPRSSCKRYGLHTQVGEVSN